MTTTPTTPLSPAPSAIYCRHCGYDLRAHQPNSEFRTQNSELRPRCPECGRVFDPSNPRTFRRRPLRRWLRHVKHAALAVLTLAMLLAAIWLWLFWGWRDEQQALRALGATSDRSEPLSPWLRAHLGSPGFVLDRAASVKVDAESPRDLTPLARLTKMNALILHGHAITDLRLLASCPSLVKLCVNNTSVSDFTPLTTLPKLEYLSLPTQILDLRRLAGLTNLRGLEVYDCNVTDLSPLAGMTQLEEIELRSTRVADLRPLLRLKLLRAVWLPEETITKEQAEELRRAVPGCTVERR